MTVPAGAVVQSGYVEIDLLRLACRDRMDIGAVEKAMQRRMACAPAQPWPTPIGKWEGERFTIYDGRHDVIAATMLGCTHLLVSWIDDRQA